MASPDPIKLNDQEVRITLRMDYFEKGNTFSVMSHL